MISYKPSTLITLAVVFILTVASPVLGVRPVAAAQPTLEAGQASASFTLDNVDLVLQAAALPGEFSVSPAGAATQMADWEAWQPFRELSIVAVPFSHKAGTELLPAATTGGAQGYAASLRDYRTKQGSQVEDLPVVKLFNKRVSGTRSTVQLNISGPQLSTVIIDEWVVESGKRLWIVRASQEQVDGSATPQPPDFAAALTLDSNATDRTTSLLSEQSLLSSETNNSEALASAIDLPAAGWWNGDCDTNTYTNAAANPKHMAAYRLGTAYRGMPACGPRPWADGAPDVTVRFFSGAWGVYEWECVELSMRFLYLAYGVKPYSANGSQVVWNYKWDPATTQLVQVSNGTAGQAPSAGDVLSMGATSTFGHTSVVMDSSVDVYGNGSVTVIEENASVNGKSVLSVSGWRVAENAGAVSGWLHDNGAAGRTNIDVRVHGTLAGSVGLAPTSSSQQSYANIQNGPVEVISTNTQSQNNIVTSERGFYGPYGTFNEVMGFPNGQLTNNYWFPWYDNTSMTTWVLIGNPSSSATAHVTVKIAGLTVGSYSIAPFDKVTPMFPGIQNGPVQVSSDVNIFTSERALYGPASSFNETLGYPDNQLTNHYWYPWYDNVSMMTWVLVGNPNSGSFAHVTIKIAGATVGTYTIPPFGRVTPMFAGIMNGPVEVSSDANIFTSERALYGPSYTFNEVMGYPDNQLTNSYWFPWYDDATMTTWVLIGNPSSSASAHVTVKIAGTVVGSYTIAPFGKVTPTFPGIQYGPVEVTSDINIFTSERALAGAASSFNEVMGFPANQLTTDYWFTWYDSKSMTTSVVVGRP